MAGVRGSFPHPVLDDSDDVGSSLELLNVVVEPSLEDVGIRYDLRSDDPDLWALIERGLARHSLRWTCSSTIAAEEVTPTRYRLAPDGVSLRTSIDQQSIREKVTVEVRVVAVDRIESFRWARQNPEYGDARFDIEAGDVLAVGGQFAFNPRKLFDPLRPPIGSCFEFREQPANRPGIELDFQQDDVINVLLPTDVFRNLGQLAARPELQIGLVVLPALLGAIQFIKESETDERAENLDDRQWYRAIIEAIEANGSLDDPALDLAQRILAHPADAALAAAVAADSQED